MGACHPEKDQSHEDQIAQLRRDMTQLEHLNTQLQKENVELRQQLQDQAVAAEVVLQLSEAPSEEPSESTGTSLTRTRPRSSRRGTHRQPPAWFTSKPAVGQGASQRGQL